LAKKFRKQDVTQSGRVEEPVQEMPAEQTFEEPEEETSDDPMIVLQNEIAAAKAEASKNWDLYLRERADLENARKRHQRDREEAIRFANDRLLKEMVPVLDNLERAIEHAGQGLDDHQGLLEGVNLTVNQFRKALEDFGVKPIKAIGADFDPNLHQAMGHVESAEQAPNTVVTEFQKGYLLHDRLLRPSLVMVAKAPSVETLDPNTENSEASEE
jgi:molecular chaperone GrpE